MADITVIIVGLIVIQCVSSWGHKCVTVTYNKPERDRGTLPSHTDTHTHTHTQAERDNEVL